MKTIIFSILFCALASCFNPSTDKGNGSASEVPANAMRETFADNPGLEKIIVNDPQGVLFQQGLLVDGVREGSWTEFNANGSVKSVTNWLRGKKEGLYLEMNSSGQYFKRITYHQDVRHGIYEEFSFPYKKEERTYQNGKLEGLVKIYYPDGKIMEEGSYKNDTRDGLSRWYDNAGNISIEYTYKNGELVKK